jgi:hypothetical protein
MPGLAEVGRRQLGAVKSGQDFVSCPSIVLTTRQATRITELKGSIRGVKR